MPSDWQVIIVLQNAPESHCPSIVQLVEQRPIWLEGWSCIVVQLTDGKSPQSFETIPLQPESSSIGSPI